MLNECGYPFGLIAADRVSTDHGCLLVKMNLLRLRLANLLRLRLTLGCRSFDPT